MRKKARKNSLAESLHLLLKEAQGSDVSVGLIINNLAGRGLAALLVLFVLPFCQPIQIPGLSTIFGIVLFFIGLRIAFGHQSWMPRQILERKVSYEILEKISTIAIKITNKLRFLTSTRMVYLVQNPILHIAHGIAIAILAFLLALPLPIPLTNLFAAYPILAFGLALLEDDGVMIIVAYVLFFICLAVFASLLFVGNTLFSFIST
nr:hypothetical protein OJOKFFHK_00015 [uncultured bacterium]